MKIVFAILTGLISTSAIGSTVHTADNLNYIIVLKDNVSVDDCAVEVCNIAKANGNGSCKILGTTLGILGANLTTYAADQVSQNRCVEAVEVEGTKEARPRVGRSN
jgi:hypothetical protein